MWPGALAPQPQTDPPRLDKPQRLGFLPTTAFWQRGDVWKIAGPAAGMFVFLWLLALDLLVFESTPIWASAILAGIGPFLFIALLERYLRSRIQRPRPLVPHVEGEQLAEGKPPKAPATVLPSNVNRYQGRPPCQ